MHSPLEWNISYAFDQATPSGIMVKFKKTITIDIVLKEKCL